MDKRDGLTPGEKLLPCPFCGCLPKMVCDNGPFLVECPSCRAAGGRAPYEGKAAKFWNRRSESVSLSEPSQSSHEDSIMHTKGVKPIHEVGSEASPFNTGAANTCPKCNGPMYHEMGQKWCEQCDVKAFEMDPHFSTTPPREAPAPTTQDDKPIPRPGCTTHFLKCWPEPFSAKARGNKPMEIRKYDRDYQVGDVLVEQEWDPDTEKYSGKEIRELVTYLISGKWGLPGDIVVMATRILDASPPAQAPPTDVREVAREKLKELSRLFHTRRPSEISVPIEWVEALAALSQPSPSNRATSKVPTPGNMVGWENGKVVVFDGQGNPVRSVSPLLIPASLRPPPNPPGESSQEGK
jgi:hypothetical protein